MASLRTAALRLQLVDQVTKPAGLVGRALQGVENRIKAFDASIARTRGQFFGAAGAAAAAGAALAVPIRRAMEFENAMADIRKVVDFESPEAFAKMSADILDLSRRLPMTAEGIAAIVAAAGQSGLENDELLEFAEMAAKVGVAWEVSAAEAGEALAKLKTALGLTVAETGSLADAINHLGNNSAGSASDILNFTRRVAPMAGAFGLSADQAAAFGAAMIGSGFEAEVAATSFMNMGRALTRGASATKRQRSAMQELGLESSAVAKAMQTDALGTIDDVLTRLRAAPAHMRASLMSDIFGDEARALGPLLENAELLSQVLDMVADTSGYAGSAQAEFAERAKTTANSLQLLRNKTTAAAIAFGDVLLPSINSGAAALGPLVDSIGRFVSAHPGLVKAAVAVTAGLLGLRVAALGGKLAFLLLGRQALVAAGGLLKVAAWAQNAAGGAIALQTALGAMSGQKLTGLQKLSTGFRGIVTALPGLGLVKGALAAIGSVLAGISAPVAVVIGGLVAGGLALWKYWDRISSVFAGVGRAIGEQFAPALEAVRPVLDWLAPVGNTIASGWRSAMDALSSFGGWIKSFFSREVLSDSEKAAWADSGYQVATAMIESVKAKVSELVDWFRGLPSRIMAAIGRIDIGGMIKWPSLPNWLGGGAPAPAGPPTPNGTRASGGPVNAGMLYKVGERGVELFSPSRDGHIIPNDQIQDSMGGSAPARGSAITVHAPINLTFNGVTLEQAIAAAKKAGQDSVDAFTRQLDASLSRSSQIQYGGIGLYGDY